MARQQGWVFDPDSGGIRIPEPVRRRVEARLRSYAEQHFGSHYTRLDVRFRGQFCYVDAYTEPELPPGWPPANGLETREACIERLRNTPNHLCRLRYFGDEEGWGFGFYAYRSERYELSVFPSGEFLGPPEEAFQVAAQMYLQ
jgi:hypothetical protein